MEHICKLMELYAEKHEIEHGVTLMLEDDGSGWVNKYVTDDELFSFTDENDLINKLLDS